jgi:hypothetical protein
MAHNVRAIVILTFNFERISSFAVWPPVIPKPQLLSLLPRHKTTHGLNYCCVLLMGIWGVDIVYQLRSLTCY